MKIMSANRIAPGTSHLWPFCLPMSHKKEARLIWVKISIVDVINGLLRFVEIMLEADNLAMHYYRKVPKYLDTRKICCNLPKIQTKRQNLLIFRLKDSNGIANSEYPDQSDLGLHCLPKTVCPKIKDHYGTGLLVVLLKFQSLML